MKLPVIMYVVVPQRVPGLLQTVQTLSPGFPDSYREFQTHRRAGGSLEHPLVAWANWSAVGLRRHPDSGLSHNIGTVGPPDSPDCCPLQKCGSETGVVTLKFPPNPNKY